MRAVPRHYNVRSRSSDVSLAVETAVDLVARHAAAVMLFGAFCAVWTAVFYLALQ